MESEPGKRTVMIVEDDPANRILLEENLKGLNLDIIHAANGIEALEKAEKNDLAVILMDAQMPGMDGFEAAARLRATEKTKYIPIIFITSLGKTENFEFKGYEAGAVDYIAKPANEEILKSKTRIFIEMHEQKKIIESQKAELARKVEELEKLNRELKKALDEIQTLQGIIPICVHCKKIRNDKGYWEAVEKYITDRADVGFSHGICPDCLKKYFPDIANDVLSKIEQEKAVRG